MFLERHELGSFLYFTFKRNLWESSQLLAGMMCLVGRGEHVLKITEYSYMFVPVIGCYR